MNKAYIGVDNGSSGAVCIMLGKKATVHPVELVVDGKDKLIDAVWLRALLQTIPPDYAKLAVVEKAQKFTLGRLALASTWLSWGILHTVFALENIRARHITPQAWQSKMFKGLPRASQEDTKANSIKAAQILFPTVSLLRSARCRTPDHNMADALLMAEWGRVSNL